MASSPWLALDFNGAITGTPTAIRTTNYYKVLIYKCFFVVSGRGTVGKLIGSKQHEAEKQGHDILIETSDVPWLWRAPPDLSPPVTPIT